MVEVYEENLASQRNIVEKRRIIPIAFSENCEQSSLILHQNLISVGFPGGAGVKNPPANAGDTGLSLVQEDPTCRGATKPVRHNY